MNGGIYLGRLFGIPFRIHWSWFLAVFLIASSARYQFLPEFRDKPAWCWGLGLVVAIGMFASVLLHELGHAFVARRFDIPVRGIRLFIFGGVAELGGEPKKPSHEILLALGGPIVTVILVFLFAAGFVFFLGSLETPWEWSEDGIAVQGLRELSSVAVVRLLFILAAINLMLLVFNMIPGFPLDGGRVLRGILWWATGDYLKGTRIAALFGVGFAWVMVLWGFFRIFEQDVLGGAWSVFIGIFLNNAAQSSVASAHFIHALSGIRVRDLMRMELVAIPADLTADDVIHQYFLRFPFKAFPVMEGNHYVGMLTLDDLKGTTVDERAAQTAADLAGRSGKLAELKPDESLLDAVRLMSETGQGRLPVVQDGRLLGLLSRRDIMGYLEVRLALGKNQGQGAA